jgi:phosphoserine phosphatase
MSKPAVTMVATLIAGAGRRLDSNCVAAARAACPAPQSARWLERDAALDLFFSASADDVERISGEIEAELAGRGVDVVVQAEAHRRKALLVADMDSTTIVEECLDELAKMRGVGAEVAALTARAMRGEIDFARALEARVALFAGVEVGAILRLALRMTPSPGARALVATMRAQGAYTALVSGGFTLFARPIAARLGFDAVFANALEVEAGRLTGGVLSPIQGAAEKARVVRELRDARGLAPEATVAVGDGANDLDMLAEAGLGVAYRAKPILAGRAQARLEHADLTALLYAQGVTPERSVET